MVSSHRKFLGTWHYSHLFNEIFLKYSLTRLDNYPNISF